MITSEEARKLEDSAGVTKLVLMERAGKAVAEELSRKFGIKNKKILVVAYHGNNGGDGFVAARHLCDDAEVDVLFVGDETRLKGDALANFKRLENNDKVQIITMEAIDFSDYDIIIDALFGTGISGEIKDPIATLIRNLSKSRAFKVSVDVPSGVNPDTGEKANAVFEPDLVVTMHGMKKGLESYRDRAVVVDLGVNKADSEQ